jgi:hypothetical protein
MSSTHDYKYTFVEPRSIREAKMRLHEVQKDIWNMEKQLGDKTPRFNHDENRPMTPAEQKAWRSKKIRPKHIFAQVERARLMDWIAERRREATAEKLQVTNPNDGREILIAARTVIRKVLDEKDEPDELGRLFDVIEQFLVHAA